MQNNIHSFTLSLVDEVFIENDELVDYFKKSHNTNEFVSIFPIQQFDIYNFLEGIVKIQSNLHDELHQSSSKYYYTSYFSTLSFAVYLTPLIPMLISSAIGILVQISKKDSMLLIGIILAACLLSITIPILVLTENIINKMGYFSLKCPNSKIAKSVNLSAWFKALIFVVLLSTYLVIFCINIFIKLLRIQKNSRIYKNIIISIKVMNNMFLLVFSIFLSIKNFSILVFLIPIISLIVSITDSSTARKFTIGSIFISTILNFYFDENKKNWTCLLSKIITKARYLLLGIANVMHSNNLAYNFGFDINRARNSASIWNSVMGNEIFCHNEHQYPKSITNFCNKLLDNFDQVSRQYKIIKSIPILQWISWLEIKTEKKFCDNRKSLYEIFTENLFHLLKDDRCLKSTMFKHLLIGLLSPLILALSLTFL